MGEKDVYNYTNTGVAVTQSHKMRLRTTCSSDGLLTLTGWSFRKSLSESGILVGALAVGSCMWKCWLETLWSFFHYPLKPKHIVMTTEESAGIYKVIPCGWKQSQHTNELQIIITTVYYIAYSSCSRQGWRETKGNCTACAVENGRCSEGCEECSGCHFVSFADFLLLNLDTIPTALLFAGKCRDA